MTNTIKWDKPCYKCLSHLCDLSCKEKSKTKEQDDEVLGFNGWGFPIEKPNKAMTTQTEALKMALKELETWQRFTHGENEHTNNAITAIKEALAQPEQEPVAYQDSWIERWYGSPPFEGWLICCGDEHIAHLGTEVSGDEVRKIVNAHNRNKLAPQRKPLTDEQKCVECFAYGGHHRLGCIEAAHGKGDA